MKLITKYAFLTSRWCTIVLLCLFTFSCSEENSLQSIQIEEVPNSRRLIVKKDQEVIFEVNKIATKPVDISYLVFIDTTWRIPNSSSLVSETLAHMKYNTLMASQTDSLFHGLASLNLILKKLNIRRYIDFSGKEGQGLGKIIFQMRTPMEDSLGFYPRMFTNPSMPFCKGIRSINNDSLFTRRNIDFKNGKISERDYLDQIQDRIIMTQFEQMTNRNSTVVLVAHYEAERPWGMSLFYQYLQDGVLQIGEMPLDLHHVGPLNVYE